ncbi:MAG: sigma-54-dependent Fis family transcriptional regulator [Thermodesulfovibrionales bacterium]|nr:sigma-54-dependent Fis family transcriptional regulator [Thermodesulfovibrionales bacterium]
MAEELILIVDDEEGIRESLSGIITDEGYRVASVESGEEALKYVEKETPELIFLDVWLPGIDGLETLQKIKAKIPDTAVVMISGHGTIETAVKATAAGAYDFIEKPLSLERVVLAASRALEKGSLLRENRKLRETLQQKWRLVGESPSINMIRSQIDMVSKSNSRVLITGESGTGKEIVAHLVHELSERADGPFVEVNCAAIPHDLIESELFGHEKGSFTGAFEQKRGKFEQAHKGTLFLDEIGDMSFQTQAKLLRVLESQEIQRVGGSKNIAVDTRVIAATNQDVEELIKEGRFRNDLYFRLNVIPVALSPLRERREDIPQLVEYFLGQLAAEYRQPVMHLSAPALELLLKHSWPGNIRELKNMIERLVIMTPGEEIGTEGIVMRGESASGDYFGMNGLREAREAFEREFIFRKLSENGWNVSRTAEVLEIERSNLHRKIKSFGIKIP